MRQRGSNEGLKVGVWLALAVVMVGVLAVSVARSDAPDASGPADPAMPIVPRADHVPPPGPVRTISILSGEAVRYAVIAHQGRVVLDLLMHVRRDAYEQLPAFRRCLRGCRLRVYIVQERRR